MSCVVVASPLLLLLLLLVALQAVLLLWLCDLPPWLFWTALPWVCLYVAWEKRRLGRMTGRLSTRERRWYWRARGEEVREFGLCGELVLWRWLLVINGRDWYGRRVCLVLARDALHADDWRRLQVALRYSR
ncbi:protein YgfX [Microbulbifer sp. 2205BS26-8]|uniref:protein YgfX n=1 Tax=Microbulbifer sp. 2205BS26-8 TaxID=3064386 RepID=UPI00273F12E6|nr:protein YgfX [Microbulbifer sp. 2205BS26-8]MDP5210595.1 hypothetical protein [Microbulbifer sp. 2205BS26-8]